MEFMHDLRNICTINGIYARFLQYMREPTFQSYMKNERAAPTRTALSLSIQSKKAKASNIF